MGEKETMAGAGLVQDEAARSQYEKMNTGGMVQDEAARSQYEKMNTGGMVQDEAARSQYEKMNMGDIVQDEAARGQYQKLDTTRQTPKRDFGDRKAAASDDPVAPAETGRVRLDPTPARLSTNMSVERQAAGLGAGIEPDDGDAAGKATSGLKDTLKTQV